MKTFKLLDAFRRKVEDVQFAGLGIGGDKSLFAFDVFKNYGHFVKKGFFLS